MSRLLPAGQSGGGSGGGGTSFPDGGVGSSSSSSRGGGGGVVVVVTVHEAETGKRLEVKLPRGEDRTDVLRRKLYSFTGVPPEKQILLCGGPPYKPLGSQLPPGVVTTPLTASSPSSGPNDKTNDWPNDGPSDDDDDNDNASRPPGGTASTRRTRIYLFDWRTFTPQRSPPPPSSSSSSLSSSSSVLASSGPPGADSRVYPPEGHAPPSPFRLTTTASAVLEGSDGGVKADAADFEEFVGPAEVLLPMEPGAAPSPLPSSAGSVLLATIANYERGSMLALNRGQAYLDSFSRRLRGGEACVERMQTQIDALEAAVSNSLDHWEALQGGYNGLKEKLEEQALRHEGMLETFEEDLATLGTIPLHPALSPPPRGSSGNNNNNSNNNSSSSSSGSGSSNSKPPNTGGFSGGGGGGDSSIDSSGNSNSSAAGVLATASSSRATTIEDRSSSSSSLLHVGGRTGAGSRSLMETAEHFPAGDGDGSIGFDSGGAGVSLQDQEELSSRGDIGSSSISGISGGKGLVDRGQRQEQGVVGVKDSSGGGGTRRRKRTATLLDCVPVEKEQKLLESCRTSQRRFRQEAEAVAQKYAAIEKAIEEQRGERSVAQSVTVAGENGFDSVQTVLQRGRELRRQQEARRSELEASYLESFDRAAKKNWRDDKEKQDAIQRMTELTVAQEKIVPVMKENDNKVMDTVVEIVRAKAALSLSLRKRLREVSKLQTDIGKMQKRQELVGVAWAQKEEQFEHLGKVAKMPAAYEAFVLEVVRRRQYQQELETKVSDFCNSMGGLRSVEIVARETCRQTYLGHLPPMFLEMAPGLRSMPPAFILAPLTPLRPGELPEIYPEEDVADETVNIPPPTSEDPLETVASIAAATAAAGAQSASDESVVVGGEDYVNIGDMATRAAAAAAAAASAAAVTVTGGTAAIVAVTASTTEAEGKHPVPTGEEGEGGGRSSGSCGVTGSGTVRAETVAAATATAAAGKYDAGDKKIVVAETQTLPAAVAGVEARTTEAAGEASQVAETIKEGRDQDAKATLLEAENARLLGELVEARARLEELECGAQVRGTPGPETKTALPRSVVPEPPPVATITGGGDGDGALRQEEGVAVGPEGDAGKTAQQVDVSTVGTATAASSASASRPLTPPDTTEKDVLAEISSRTSSRTREKRGSNLKERSGGGGTEGADVAAAAVQPSSKSGRRGSGSSKEATQNQLAAYRAGLTMLVKLADHLAASVAPGAGGGEGAGGASIRADWEASPPPPPTSSERAVGETAPPIGTALPEETPGSAAPDCEYLALASASTVVTGTAARRSVPCVAPSSPAEEATVMVIPSCKAVVAADGASVTIGESGGVGVDFGAGKNTNQDVDPVASKSADGDDVGDDGVPAGETAGKGVQNDAVEKEGSSAKATGREEAAAGTGGSGGEQGADMTVTTGSPLPTAEGREGEEGQGVGAGTGAGSPPQPAAAAASVAAEGTAATAEEAARSPDSADASSKGPPPEGTVKATSTASGDGVAEVARAGTVGATAAAAAGREVVVRSGNRSMEKIRRAAEHVATYMRRSHGRIEELVGCEALASVPRISMCSFSFEDIALFLPTMVGSPEGSSGTVFLAFHVNCPNRYLSEESVSTARQELGSSPAYILGRIIMVEQFVATEEDNPYNVAVNTVYYVLTAENFS